MSDDIIEMPSCRILYRQSSLETRLSPVHLSDASSSDSEQSEGELKERQTVPIIVECKIKEDRERPDLKFKEELSDVLKKNFLQKRKEQRRCQEIGESFVKAKGEQVMNLSETSLVGSLKAITFSKKKEEEEAEIVGGNKMATARPKSPSPRPVAIRGEKDESIWDKLGTLGRKKRIKEVQEVQAEGKYAIDSPGCPAAPIVPPEEYNLDDNEERCMIDKRAYDDAKFIELLNVLKEWINDELASQRIIVQDLSEDLYDGQVLQKLLEKLTGDKLDVPEVTQSEEGQRQKLSVVLGHFNQVLGIQRIAHNKWSVEAIHSKNIVAITHLLVALARHFRPPVRLPEHVSVDVVVVQKVKGVLNHKVVRESLTKAYDDVGMRCERDAFDTLFDHAPDKLQVVKKSLVTFVNKHLNKMNFEVTEIESQFHDGVYLIMLMGLLEGFFVPHYIFHLTPHEFDQKVHNVSFAFELMEEVGLQKPKARPEDVVNMDLKSTLRVLYNLFLKYKTII
ncbi:hypothetical protein NQ315_000961 [Exocentrus adspersus]|uniref:Calponin-homology (CH) domain-containing protein n=1 Tax=Exocentrus adspersus TaxID=1586481 RepID=A0AAV8WEN5_9CUCU|nr:hypothetical protein NQ315_000961 [Exocentrus adspersus]